MKIIIDIDKDLYKGIERRDGALETEYVCDELMKAIDNGTPLPKGHGRLIDADALKVSMGDDWKTGNEIANCIKSAPIIIESDKEIKE